MLRVRTNRQLSKAFINQLENTRLVIKREDTEYSILDMTLYELFLACYYGGDEYEDVLHRESHIILRVTYEPTKPFQRHFRMWPFKGRAKGSQT